MSRYTLKISKDSRLNYGFDHALGYWFDIFEDVNNPEKEEHEMVVKERASIFGMKKEEMIETLEKYNAPKAHVEAVAMDIPF